MSAESLASISAIGDSDPVITNLGSRPTVEEAVSGNGFGDILSNMVGDVEAKVDAANELVREFAVDDNVPVHKVTFALEEARLSVEMMMQVRTRLVEGYRQIMNMQM